MCQQWLSAARVRMISAEFYASLMMAMTVEPPDVFSRREFEQLTRATNQFNFTTRRYSEGDVRTKLADPSCGLYVATLRDRFGDLGVIGAAIVNRENVIWGLDTS